ncbi:type II toxin-antitoxin system RelE/ParE family toxin [Reyranella sp.]|uniref:type II toxin-antitoxin system RelE/ParE family toxin n=1 Tax=Reyranella sp. TaxID=1929291 RepID=UPI002F92BE5C
MYSVRVLPSFADWLDGLRDAAARGLIAARIKRLEMGLMGDAKSVGGSVMELRIHRSPGWRVYFTRRSGNLIVLLAGGSKATQAKDIRRAIALAAQIE